MDASSSVSAPRAYSSSGEDEASFMTARTDRTSSDDSVLFFSQKSPKSPLQVRRPDTVTNVSHFLQADLNDADIAAQLKASPNSHKNWPLFGMSKGEFITRAHELGLSPAEAAKLVSDVQGFVYNLLENPPVDQVHHAEKILRNAEQLPPVASCKKIAATNAVAGIGGFLTSFFLGKCAANLLGLAVGSQGAWIFPIAGLLNVLVSEPVVGAIRMQGAFHPSADGVAYTDYNTACARFKKAETLGDSKRIQHWTKVVAKIVDSVIAREKANPDIWFRSGVDKPERDADGVALDSNGAPDPNFAKLAEKVICGARKRSFVTDELPFNFYTVNYFLSGVLAPYFRAICSPGMASGIDIALSGLLGMISGAETALLQDYLRRDIQKVPMRSLTNNIKYAKVALAAAKRDAWVDPMNRVTACETVLRERFESLHGTGEDGQVANGRSINKATADLIFAKDVRRMIVREHHKAKKHHEAHTAGRHRFGTQVGALVNAYLGEKSDPPQPLQGRRAINRVVAKIIATPLSLTFTPLYTSVVVPAILATVSAANAFAAMHLNGTAINSTVPDIPTNSTTVSNHLDPDSTLALGMGLSALFSIPLILGYMSRNLAVAPVIERAITDLETRYSVRMPEDDSESEDYYSDSDSAVDDPTHHDVLHSVIVSGADDSGSGEVYDSDIDPEPSYADPSGVLESVVVTESDKSGSSEGYDWDSES